MNKIFLGAILVFGVIVTRMIALPEDSVLGTAIVVVSAVTFVVVGGRYALNHAPSVDCDGNQ